MKQVWNDFYMAVFDITHVIRSNEILFMKFIIDN